MGGPAEDIKMINDPPTGPSGHYTSDSELLSLGCQHTSGFLRHDSHKRLKDFATR